MFLAEEGLIAVFVLFLKYRFGWGPLDIGISMSVFGLTYCVSQVPELSCIAKAHRRHDDESANPSAYYPINRAC
jgi:hypothetical protein